MAQTTVIGRVTADLELKESVNKNSYIQFNLAEHIGYGETARTQYFEVWAYKNLAHQLIKGSVKKGSLLCVSGPLELVGYTKKDGVTKDKKLKLTLKDWDFVPAGRGRSSGKNEGAPKAPAEPSTPTETIDGERDELPG